MDGWQSNRWQTGEQMKGCGETGTSVPSRNSDDVWKVFGSGLRNESEGEEEWKWNTAADNSSPPERRVFCQDRITSGWSLIAVTLRFCCTVEVPLKTCVKLSHRWDKSSDISLLFKREPHTLARTLTNFTNQDPISRLIEFNFKPNYLTTFKILTIDT